MKNLINTPLQRGVRVLRGTRNRFNAFHKARKTIETVFSAAAAFATPLKRGVNERTSIGSVHTREACGLGFLVGLLTIANLACAQPWTASTAPLSVWQALAASADGTKLVAAVTIPGGIGNQPLFPPLIYTSTDAGATWTPTAAPENGWTAVASSADGTKLAAASYLVAPWSIVGDGWIYTSTDSGATRAPTGAPAKGWWAAASSADGTRLVAATASSSTVANGLVYVSGDAGVTWTRTSAPSNVWTTIASSADGTKLAAAARNYLAPGGIYTSTDSGGTWVRTCAPTNFFWYAIASSADGTKLVAAANDGPIYTSCDSGRTWVQTSSPTSFAWNSVASSADGTRLVAAANEWEGYIFHPGAVYTSTDSGATWTDSTPPLFEQWDWGGVACSADGYRVVVGSGTTTWFGGYICALPYAGPWRVAEAPTNYWGSVAASADGTKLIAADSTELSGVGDGLVYISTNSGASWAPTTAPSNNWTCVASSWDGTKLVAAGDASIYISTNSGATWAPTTAPSDGWSAVASSADGARLVAAAGGWVGSIYISTNLGANLFSAGAPADGDGLWPRWSFAVTVSADGSNIVAVGPDFIFTLRSPAPAPPPPPSPRLSIAVSGTTLTLSWLVPSVPFVLQQSSDLGSSNWVDVALASPPTLNLTNLHNELTLPPAIGVGSQFYRLKQR